jgi:hypothetical protein
MMIQHEHDFSIGDIVNVNDWPFDAPHTTGRIERIEGIYVWLEGNEKAWHMSGVEKAGNVIIPDSNPPSLNREEAAELGVFKIVTILEVIKLHNWPITAKMASDVAEAIADSVFADTVKMALQKRNRDEFYADVIERG